MLAHLGPNLQFPCGREPCQCLTCVQIGGKEGLAHLCKVFADGIGGAAEIVTEWTGTAGLAGALAEELARDVARVWESWSARREQVAAGDRRQHWGGLAVGHNVLGGLRGPSKRGAAAAEPGL